MPALASEVMKGLIEPERGREIAVMRLFDCGGALRRRADQPYRVLLGETEIDEEFRIVDFDSSALAFTGVLNGNVKCSVRTVSFGSYSRK